MAFLIFALSFQQLYVGWGLRAHAADIHATNTDKTSSTMANGTEIGGYTYSGKYTVNNKVTLFDYVSDYEISTNTYNNCLQNESRYVDAFVRFNNTISSELFDSTINDCFRLRLKMTV